MKTRASKFLFLHCLMKFSNPHQTCSLNGLGVKGGSLHMQPSKDIRLTTGRLHNTWSCLSLLNSSGFYALKTEMLRTEKTHCCTPQLLQPTPCYTDLSKAFTDTFIQAHQAARDLSYIAICSHVQGHDNRL